MELQPDTLFHNRYRLIEEKGRGSFGEVWLARDEQLELEVAIKIYIALDDRGISDFKEEYRTAYTLNHPNLLHAYHFDLENRCPYLVMPYCPGKSTDLIGRADEADIWRFIRDVVAGLSYLHALDIVHHDIKPDNILRDANGVYLIADFGISTKMRSTLRRNSTRAMTGNSVGGALPYMGPETFSDRPESVKATDIWALGATLFEIVTGELPFFGQGGGMLLHGAAIPALDGEYSDDLKRTVTACLAKETWERPTAAQLLEYAQSKIDGKSSSCPWAQEAKSDPQKTIRQEKHTFAKTEPVTPPKPVADKKRGSGIYWAWGSILTMILLAAIFIPNYHRGEELLSEYRTKISECEQMIAQGSQAEPQALIDARQKLNQIIDFEKRYEGRYSGIDKSVQLSNTLDSKLKTASAGWSTAAEAQSRIGNTQKAVEFYATALRLYKSQTLRQKFEKEAEKIAYLKPLDLEFKAQGQYGETLYADKIKYLYTRLKYDSWDTESSHEVELKVKIYENGHLSSGENSGYGYTFKENVTIRPAMKVEYIDLSGWGNENGGSYSPGTVRVEIWCNSKKLISKSIKIN